MEYALQGGRFVGKMNTTFRNLQILETARNTVKAELGNEYEKKVMPFIKLIQMVMKANEVDHFTAMLKIKTETSLYNSENAALLFSAGLMELVENEHFAGFQELEIR
jgi:hypothetical protein